MAAAFRKAQATLDGFLEIAKRPTPNLASISLKVGISDGPYTEYFWVIPFKAEADGFSGTLNNEPRVVRNARLGQILRFKRSDVVDWMYFDTEKNRMYGNYTACALLTQESPAERAKFMKENGLKCDD